MRTSHQHASACAGCMAGPPAEADDGAVPELPGEAHATKPVLAGQAIVATLTTMAGRRDSVAWDGKTVTYSIGTGALPPGHAEWDPEHGGYAAMSPAMERAAAEAFELWDDLIAISLVERQDDPGADITFNYSEATDDRTFARHAYYPQPGRADHTMADADIWLAAGWSTHDEDADLYKGGYGPMTYLHEIGHGLGLSHPGAYNFSASFAADATHFQDTRAYTVMSYFNANENGSGTDHVVDAGRRYPATPMLNDIVAAQAVYGADVTTRTGATVYGFGSTAGRAAFDFRKNPDPVIAIWDAGGADVIDLSGWDTDQRLDLNEGAFSSVGRLTDNLAIAHGAVIENAVAGGGDDVLVGNAATNVLRGGAGDDRLEGRAGGDALWGGAGADHLDGGSGSDWVRYAEGGDAVKIDLARRAGAGGEAAGDTYSEIENATGTRRDDLLVGHAGTNKLQGRGGDDRLLGRDGRDVLSGGEGDDILKGGRDDDRLLGDEGDDVFEGGAGEDHLDGGAGSDLASYAGAGSAVSVSLGEGRGLRGEALGDRLVRVEDLLGSAHDDRLYGSGAPNHLRGGAGDDRISASGGDDRLHGGPGADRLSGGSGADWVIYADSGRGVEVDLLRGRGHGGDAEGDVFDGIENVSGSAARDLLIGAKAGGRVEGRGGDDRLYGGKGDHVLLGGDGDDMLRGGQGTDLLDGGAGMDLFVFAAKDGCDRITGFQLAEDRISIIGAASMFDDLSLAPSGAGVWIGYGPGDAILLAGIGADEIGEDVFLFA